MKVVGQGIRHEGCHGRGSRQTCTLAVFSGNFEFTGYRTVSVLTNLMKMVFQQLSRVKVTLGVEKQARPPLQEGTGLLKDDDKGPLLQISIFPTAKRRFTITMRTAPLGFEKRITCCGGAQACDARKATRACHDHDLLRSQTNSSCSNVASYTP